MFNKFVYKINETRLNKHETYHIVNHSIFVINIYDKLRYFYESRVIQRRRENSRLA